MEQSTCICKKCGDAKPFTGEHFAPGRTGAPMRVCRACRWPKPQDVPEGSRRCTKCHEVKPETAACFQPRASRSGIASLQSWCRACQIAYNTERSKNKLEESRAKVAKHRAANLDRLRESDRLYKEKLRRADPVAMRLKNRLWAQANIDKVRAQARARYPQDKHNQINRNRNRRALKKGSTRQHTPADIQAQIETQSGQCFYCQSVLDLVAPRATHADHFIPLTRGGSNGPENIVIACQTCNCSKKDSLPWDWMPERFARP